MSVAVAAPRSTFVTVLAWILIGINALGVLSAVAQNLVLMFLPQWLGDPQDLNFGAMFGPLRVLAMLLLFFAALMTYASYAFLLRRDWARRLFVASFVLAIVMNVLWMIGLGWGMGGLTLPPQTVEGVDVSGILRLLTVASFVFAFGTTVLFAWLVKRLSSPAVKAEFGAPVSRGGRT